MNFSGRVINGLGKPLDGKGEIFTKERYPVMGKTLNPLTRSIIEKPLSVGVSAIDGLITVGKGTEDWYIFRFRCWQIDSFRHDSAVYICRYKRNCI